MDFSQKTVDAMRVKLLERFMNYLENSEELNPQLIKEVRMFINDASVELSSRVDPMDSMESLSGCVPTETAEMEAEMNRLLKGLDAPAYN